MLLRQIPKDLLKLNLKKNKNCLQTKAKMFIAPMRGYVI